MPDGYSVDLDQFQGLDQIGQEGLKDKVNNHYLQIFGTSIAFGVICRSEARSRRWRHHYHEPVQAFTNGAAASAFAVCRQQSLTLHQIPPTITIRGVTAVKVYFTQDLLLLAYSNRHYCRRRIEEAICAESIVAVQLLSHSDPLRLQEAIAATLPIQRRCAKHSSSVFIRIPRLRSAGWEEQDANKNAKKQEARLPNRRSPKVKRTSLTLRRKCTIPCHATTFRARRSSGRGLYTIPLNRPTPSPRIEHEERSISNQVQQIENGQQIFSNTVKIASTATPNLQPGEAAVHSTHQMILAPRMLYSRFLSPTSGPATDCNRSRIPTATRGGWVISANTGNGASAAYQQVSVLAPTA